MAIQILPSFKYRAGTYASRPAQFQRGQGKVHIKKVQKKIALKFRHIIVFFVLLAGAFYLLYKFYFFLISSEQFNVKRTSVICRRQEVKNDLQGWVAEKEFGNIFLLDISQLQNGLKAHRWVKEVRIRKVFPSLLTIDVREREPFAVAMMEKPYLIDEEGVLLEEISSEEETHLPLLVDMNNFERDAKIKFSLAKECLESLPAKIRIAVELLDLSDYGSITLQLKEEPARLILGGSLFAEKLGYFLAHEESWKERFGELEYVDLRFFEDRIYFKHLKHSREPSIPNSKEAE